MGCNSQLVKIQSKKKKIKLGSLCSVEKSGKSRLTPISKLPRAGNFNKIELA